MNIQEILNFYFSKYEDGTIIYGNSIKRILKNDWHDIQINSISKNEDESFLIPKDNIKTFGDTLVGMVVKDQSGNVDIKIVDASCCIFANIIIENIFENYDTEEMFNEYELYNLTVRNIKVFAEDTKISIHYNISLLEAYCKNYKIDKNTLVDSKEKEMSNQKTIQDLLNEEFESCESGSIVVGEQIRKLLQKKKPKNWVVIHKQKLSSLNENDFFLIEDHLLKVGYNVDSLYGVIVDTEHGKDVEILGTISDMFNKDKIIENILTKNNEIDQYFTDEKFDESHFSCYEDLVNDGFKVNDLKRQHKHILNIYKPKSFDDIKNHINAFQPNKSRRISTIYNSYQEKNNFTETEFNMNAKVDNAIPTPKSLQSIMETFLKTNQESKSENSQKVHEKMSMKDRTISNLEEGAYQGVAKAAVSNVIDLFIAGAAASGIDPNSVEKIKELLKTEIGFAVLSMAIGSGVMLIPDNYADNKHVQKLADKCQQNASAAGVSQAINLAVNILKPAIEAAINGSQEIKMLDKLTSKNEKVRVADKDISEEEYALIEEYRAKKNC